MAVASKIPEDHSGYGKRLGEGAARCFSIWDEHADRDQQLKLMPVPESFICPISNDVMKCPVCTVDGCVYEKGYITQWIQFRKQHRLPITSPSTGLELQSTFLLPLEAISKAIETYMAHRPELKQAFATGQSLEEAAAILQKEFLDEQASHSYVEYEMERLNRRLSEAEATIE